MSYREKVGDEPTGRERPDLLRVKPSHGHADTIVNGISRIGFMSGGKSARWVDEDMAKTITGKAVSFIERNREKPFFLYFATHDIHVPRVPHAQFRGTTQCGIRCDAIGEFDWSVGQIAGALDRLKLADDTLVIVTSDNGPVLDNGYADGSEEDVNGHLPAGPWRGRKGSLYEGGTRVPFIATWPARIRPRVSDALDRATGPAGEFRRADRPQPGRRCGPGQLQRAAGAAGRFDAGTRPPGGIRQWAGHSQGPVETHSR